MEERQRRRDADEAGITAERAAAAPKAAKGLDFRNYLRIQRGMTEGELLGIAGEPDFQNATRARRSARRRTVQVRPPILSVAAVAARCARCAPDTYLPTSGDPFITTITLIGGRVSDSDRVTQVLASGGWRAIW